MNIRLPKLGDELGYNMEPDKLWARLVGIRKDPNVTKWAVIRLYRECDRVGVPTGEYRVAWMLVPWTGTTHPQPKYIGRKGTIAPLDDEVWPAVGTSVPIGKLS